MNIDDNYLMNASAEQIQELTGGLKPKLHQVYNNLFIKKTEPNSIERKHWLRYCKIIDTITNKFSANNSHVNIIFYKNNLDNELYNLTLDGRNNIHKFLMNMWEYTNKDNLYIIPNNQLFGIKYLYNEYKKSCKNIINPFIYQTILNNEDIKINNNNLHIEYKIIINDNNEI